jgi:hypothetical protein
MVTNRLARIDCTKQRLCTCLGQSTGPRPYHRGEKSRPNACSSRLFAMALVATFATNALPQSGPANLNLGTATINSGTAAYQASSDITTNSSFTVGGTASVL